MKKVVFITDKLYQNNIIFDKNQTNIFIRDNIFDTYYTLYEILNKNQFNIATNDIHTIQDSDIIIYNDLPKKLPKNDNIYKSYLIMKESPLVKPDNFNQDNHKYFNKIFTWNDNLVDNIKYFKINYSFNIPKNIPKKFNKKKLCSLIVGNKDSQYPNELYSERKKAIRWFENNHPESFDLFGVGWNSFKFKGILPIRAFNKIPLAKKIMFKYFGEYYPSYKGKVTSKFETMQEYKFSLCYENIKDIPGYITEKIFDAMFAGSIPIYLGANNILDYIPENTFIDKRNFDTYEELYSFINNIDEVTYIKYLENIEKFLNSKQGYKFSSECFANTITTNIS